ncbi:ATP-binding protein [Plantactinospora veratri]
MDLVRGAAEAGLPVRTELSGDLGSVDTYTGLAAYRIVQEAVSNVRHHAPGAEAVVRIVRHPDRLAVSVRNGAPARTPTPTGRGGGAGLDGMRQRVDALGGTVSAGPDGDGWLVEASLPVRRTGTGVAR